MTFRHDILGLCLGTLALCAAGSATASDYAADILREQERAAQAVRCPSVSPYLHPRGLDEADVQALLCHAVENLPLALDVGEYGAADRSELMIGEWLERGVPPAALGRAFTFYDPAVQGQRLSMFRIKDKAHDTAFRIAWQLVFGTEFPLRIELRYGGRTELLDVDGEYHWHRSHTAPTLWLRREDGTRELRVLDPLLSPDKPLTLAEWRRLQQAEPAAVLWGEIGAMPEPLAEFLPPEAQKRVQQALNVSAAQIAQAEQFNATLRGMPAEMKPRFYAHALDIDPRADWAPANWRGARLTGDDLPDWQAGNTALNAQRRSAAAERLAPFRLYHAMRRQFANDEAFLNAVRDGMRRGKRPHMVYIDFTEGR